MELKTFAKKVAIAALIGSFAATTLVACSHDDSTTTTKTDANGKVIRSKTSTYTTK